MSSITRVHSRAGVIAAGVFLIATYVAADNTPQTLPFSQDWSNTGLITANNDWSNVPGITGYRGDNLTAVTGADPQTILADETTVNVIANQSNPNGLNTGGLAEFDAVANPVVALQGSGTADAPFLLVSLNTTGQSNVLVSYSLRDIDGSTDNAIQPVALQYRVGTLGNFTNIPASFVADASTGPNLATQVTPVAAMLPAAADNEPVVQIRIITANAVGNDEWIGIDDITVTTGTMLAAVGAASPSTVNAGQTTLLTATVTPGTNPASTGIVVTADLSSIGGLPSQLFFDDATNGDVTAGDNVFSFLATVPVDVSLGLKTLPVSVADAQARTAMTSIALTVVPMLPVSVDAVSWSWLKNSYRP